MAKKQNIDRFSDIIECNGIDKNYHIEHNLNSKSIIVQLVDNETSNTFKEAHYNVRRDTENTILITFNAPPISRKKFLVLCLRV